ncbi:MAG TPA: glycosyltransferase [Solirubrobacteraceae bacterium]|nr:glycosyltransferase [Solirubrobacteraceae bacterium]
MRSLAGTLPLSGLLQRIDAHGAATAWPVHHDGAAGRALLAPPGSTATFALRLERPALMTARVMIAPHRWRDHADELLATVSVVSGHGGGRRVWSRRLRAAALGGRPSHRLVCTIPPEATELRLSTSSACPDPDAGPLLWLAPALVAPLPPWTRLPAASGREAGSSARAAAARPVSATRATAGVGHPLGGRGRARTAPRARAGEGPSAGPLFSVLTPVHDPPVRLLAEAIDSVRAQTFADWELCIVDDGCTDPEVVALLRRVVASDERIRLARRERAGGTALATNCALALATGRFVALLDHDDTLAPDALERVSIALGERPSIDMLYSDEEVIGPDGRAEPQIKPGWSPDLIRAAMYTCHLGVYRRSLVAELGGFDQRFDGCQDYDLVLRACERTDRVAHIPRILYQWRAHGGSAAAGDAVKPQAYLRQRLAIVEHLRRSGIEAEVHYGPRLGLHRIVHRVRPQTTVQVAIAHPQASALAAVAATLRSQPHPGWSIAAAGAQSALEHAERVLAAQGIPPERVSLVEVAAETEPARALAIAAERSAAEHLLLMDQPAAGLTRDWLLRLIGYAEQAGVAAAGPIVLAADGRILHAGVALPEGLPLHLHRGSHPCQARLETVRNVASLSGVLLTPRRLYERVGGLDASWRELAPVHYCLRHHDEGGRCVLVPDARLRALGPDRSVNDVSALLRLRAWRSAAGGGDPYYSAALRSDRGDFIPRDRPPGRH